MATSSEIPISSVSDGDTVASDSDSVASSSSSVVSILDRLKSPVAADIARKRITKTNPPVGKRPCRGSTSSDPKGIPPSKRVQDFPNEKLKVSGGKLFCTACREELGLKRSTVQNHVRSQKHESSKKKLEMKEIREQDIANALAKHNSEVHLRGETLPVAQQVYRVKVVTALLRAGIPLSKLDSFRDILEENAYRLSDRRHMFDLVPFILKEEEGRIQNEITGKYLSVIFDGTSRLGEAFAIIVRFVGEEWTLEHRLIRMQMLSKSMTGQEVARELISVLSMTYGVRSELLLAAMRDRASINNLAMQTVSVVYPMLVDIGCFSHTLDHVGENFKTPILTDFMHSWISLFSHSPKTRLLWKSRVGRSMATYSATRWWSKWEVVKMVMLYFGDIKPFLLENDDIGPATRPKLLSFFSDQQKLALLQLEIAATVDWGEPFVKACYFLEGDGPLALECYEAIEKVSAAIRTAHTPNVQAIAQRLSGAQQSDPRHQRLAAYAKSCVQPGLDYFERQVGSSLKSSLAAFKGARMFSPQKIYLMQPDATTLEQSLVAIPFLSSPNGDVVSCLKAELPDYLARAADTSADIPPLEWWKRNAGALPHWSEAAKKVLLLQPSSATAERVFSLLKNSFGEQQDNALQDYIECSLMLQFNKH